MQACSLTLPIKTESTLNKREHWTRRHERSATQKLIVTNALRGHLKPLAGEKVILRLTRVRPKGKMQLDRWDNLPASFKAIIDAFCEWVGVDDGDEARFSCVFSQDVGEDYSVRMSWEVK